VDEAYHALYLEHEQNTDIQESSVANQIMVYQDQGHKWSSATQNEK